MAHGSSRLPYHTRILAHVWTSLIAKAKQGILACMIQPPHTTPYKSCSRVSCCWVAQQRRRPGTPQCTAFAVEQQMPRNSSALGETDGWERNRKGRYGFPRKERWEKLFSFWDILRILVLKPLSNLQSVERISDPWRENKLKVHGGSWAKNMWRWSVDVTTSAICKTARQ